MSPVLLVVLVNAVSALAVYVIYEMGQNYAPELMASQAMNAPLVLSVLGYGGWLLYWSVRTLSGKNKTAGN